MRPLFRIAAVSFLGLLIAGAIFLIPTIWFKPWSIDHFYARAFIEMAMERPMTLSQLRILEPYGLDFYSGDLDDYSIDFARRSQHQVVRNLEILRSYDRDALPEEGRLSRDVLDWYLQLLADGEPFLFHDYPLNQFAGVHTRLPDFMVNIHQVNDVGDARSYISRLSGFGLALDQVIEGVRYRAELGIVPPRFVLEHVDGEIAELLSTAAAEHVLYTKLEEQLRALEELPADERAELLDAARMQLEETVYPAYRRLAAAVDELAADADEEAGVWRLPDGEAYYDYQLRRHTTTDMSADEIHAVGLAEVERIQAEMRRIVEAEGFDGADLGAALEALRNDERYGYPDTESGREQILADYQKIISDVAPRMPDYFGRLPQAAVAVERVPAFREGGAAGAYYRAPPFDGSKPGIFYVNLRNVAEVQRFGMRTLAFHEAIPGHHLQIAIAMEQEGGPFFRRILSFTAFTEGWALYAERLASEEGFHPTRLDQLGQLRAEVFRAVRLVVDTGIHSKRWSRERAIDYMLANTGMTESDVVAEIERYIVNPGQACSYKIGQLELLALRDRARSALGPRFDYRDFHDLVLGGGALPLSLLEDVVDDWIARRTGG